MVTVKNVRFILSALQAAVNATTLFSCSNCRVLYPLGPKISLIYSQKLLIAYLLPSPSKTSNILNVEHSKLHMSD